MPPSAERPNRLQDGISWVQKVAAVEKVFRGAPPCFQGIRVYIGAGSRTVEPRGAHEGGGRAYPPGQAFHPRGPLMDPPMNCGFLIKIIYEQYLKLL